MSKMNIISKNIKSIFFIAILILFAIFLLQNAGTIQVNFLIFEMQMPSFILIFVTTLSGLFGGYLYAIWFRRHYEKRSQPEELQPSS